MFRIDRSQVAYQDSQDVYNNVESGRQDPREAIVRDAAAELRRIQAETRQTKEAAEAETERILAEAQKEAEELRREAKRFWEEKRADAEKLGQEAGKQGRLEGLERGRAEGYQEGLRRGYTEKTAEMAKEAAQRRKEESRLLGAALADICRVQGEAMWDLREEIVGLVMDVVKKVINVELEKDDDTFMELVSGALNQMKRQGRITLRVSPEEYSHFFPEGTATFAAGSEKITVSVLEEPDFSRGDCVLESDAEIVDAGIGAQLKRVELALRMEGGAEK